MEREKNNILAKKGFCCGAWLLRTYCSGYINALFVVHVSSVIRSKVSHTPFSPPIFPRGEVSGGSVALFSTFEKVSRELHCFASLFLSFLLFWRSLLLLLLFGKICRYADRSGHFQYYCIVQYVLSYGNVRSITALHLVRTQFIFLQEVCLRIIKFKLFFW